MDELPDLEKLSVAEKDELIRELWPLRTLVRDLAAQRVPPANLHEIAGHLC